MAQPPNAKRPRTRPRRQGKLTRKRNPNPNSNPNPAPKKKLRSRKASITQDHTAYHPPRLQDLQFQNSLKAFGHFSDRRKAPAVGASPFVPLLNGPIASGAGFSAPAFAAAAPRTFLAGAPVGGLPLAQGSGYPGSLLYSGAAPNPRILDYQGRSVFFPGTLLYTGIQDGVFNPAGPNPNPMGGFLFGKVDSGEASSSGTAMAVPKPSVKGNIPSKRYKTRRRPHRLTTGARKQLSSGAPAAPRNTTSFLMRAKKSGGIAPFVSPSPVTPAVLPTPAASPFVHLPGLGDEANHEWGVDDYGSMNGLIRLRSLDLGTLEYVDNNDSESDVEQGARSVQQLEERMDHDLSRFVMTYPAGRRQDLRQDDMDIQRIDDQDSHIAHLEVENMDLRDRLYSAQQEVDDLRRRLRALEGISSSDEAEAEASPDRSVANV